MSLVKKNYKVGGVKFPVYAIIDTEKNVWFKAKEIAIILGYNNHRNAIDQHIKLSNKAQFSAPSQNWKHKLFIKEAGIYELIIAADKLNMGFKLWLATVLFPLIEKKFKIIITNKTAPPKKKQLEVNKKPIMMKQTYNLAGNDHEVNIFIDVDNVVWFRGFDVASILGYADQRHAISDHVQLCNKANLSVLCGNVTENIITNKIQGTTKFITESGIYDLALRSMKREATAFRNWISLDVLPSIRNKFGFGIMTQYLQTPIARQIDLKSTERETGFVYVATTELFQKYGIYKVGSTSNITNRMSELNTGSHVRWFTIIAFECTERLKIEFAMHKVLHSRHVEREFFKFKNNDHAIENCRKAFQICIL